MDRQLCRGKTAIVDPTIRMNSRSCKKLLDKKNIQVWHISCFPCRRVRFQWIRRHRIPRTPAQLNTNSPPVRRSMPVGPQTPLSSDPFFKASGTHKTTRTFNSGSGQKSVYPDGVPRRDFHDGTGKGGDEGYKGKKEFCQQCNAKEIQP